MECLAVAGLQSLLPTVYTAELMNHKKYVVYCSYESGHVPMN